MGLVEHLETYLGEIQMGWRWDLDGIEQQIQVVKFDAGPIAETATFTTLGLSRVDLHSSVSGMPLRQELLMMARFSDLPLPISRIMRTVTREVVKTGHTLLGGQIIGPAGRLFPNFRFEALYVTGPAYFPDEFSRCIEDGYSVDIVWLIPIYKTEAVYVRDNGWEAFEDQLVTVDPDLLDLRRKPLKL